MSKTLGNHIFLFLTQSAAIIVALGIISAFGKGKVENVARIAVKTEIETVKKCYNADKETTLEAIEQLKFYILESMPEHKRRSAENNYKVFKGKK